MSYLEGVKRFVGLDIETHDPHLKTKGASWVWGEGRVLCTAYYEKGVASAVRGDGGAKTRSLLTNPAVAIIGTNLKYDIGWLAWSLSLPIEDVRAKIIDISIVESLYDVYQDYSLSGLAKKYLGENKGSHALEKIASAKGIKGDFRAHLNTLWEAGYEDEILDYAKSDADQPVRIWDEQKKIVEKLDLHDAFHDAMATLLVTCAMKSRGVLIDYQRWQESSRRAHDILFNELKPGFLRTYGTIEVGSPKAIAALFDRLGVPYTYKIRIKGRKVTGRKFTPADAFLPDELRDVKQELKGRFARLYIEKKELNAYVPHVHVRRAVDMLDELGYETTANPKFDKYALGDLAAEHAVAADILELRNVTSIISKFLGENFSRYFVHHSKDNVRIHADFNTAGARQTGRLSSSNPNLQNIPSKTVLWPGTEQEVNFATLCREVFIPDPGRLWVKLDYSGQENVIQAHFAVGSAGDKIRELYKENPRLDEHSYVTKVSGLGDKYGEKLGRKYAKNLRFGKSYGMQIPRMMRQFGWDQDTAKEIEELVEAAAPWVYETMRYLQDLLTGNGRFRGKARPWIKTLSGRIIKLRSANEAYAFYNYLIQGSAADMMKRAMRKVWESRTCEYMRLTVHDELDIDVPATEEGLARILEVKTIMETAAEKLSIPIICDPEIGPDWAHLEGQEKDASGHPVESVEDLFRRVQRFGAKERVYDDIIEEEMYEEVRF